MKAGSRREILVSSGSQNCCTEGIFPGRRCFASILQMKISMRKDNFTNSDTFCRKRASRPAIPTRFFADRRNCKPLRLGAGDDTASACKLWQASKLHRRGSGRRFMQYAATTSYCIEILRHFYRTSRHCLNSGRIQAIGSVPCQTSWIIYANPDITPVLHWAGRRDANRIVESVETGRSGGLLAPAACDEAICVPPPAAS